MAEELATMKPQVYKDERPAEYFTRFHEHSRTHEPDAVYEIVRCLTSAISLGFYRARAIATENVPGSGPVILAPNHFSFFDHFFLGTFIRRKIRFMAKSQLFQPPMQWVYRHGGVFPVRRGHRDEEAFITARTVLGRGACVAMYPEAGRSRTGRLGEKARPGIGRLALESGAVVVPTAIHGSAKVRNWKRGQFAKVTIQYGEPIVFDREDAPSRERQQAVADEIFGRIKVLYAGLEAEGRRGVLQRVRAQRRAAREAAETKRAAPA
ncbi:MAG TPA: lysophospholipid acyltransferase family protein [Solirubrobacteraceae bacterium]|nr:lysophospholipid acyltransferase family protein [Solirubrobacteraceae bacterium]